MSIFRKYDVRGVYGKELCDVDAYLIGYYLPKFLKLKKLKVGHDMRLSYEPLTKHFLQGLIDSGCKIIYLDKVSTPCFYFSLFKGCKSGVMITASHNPKGYNGFKIMYNLDSFDSRNGLLEFEKVVLEDRDNVLDVFKEKHRLLNVETMDVFLVRNKIKVKSPIGLYVKFLVKKYNQVLTRKERGALEGIKFGQDFSSGVTSLAAVPFSEKVGLSCKFLDEVPDGRFPFHSPDPNLAKSFIKHANVDDCLFTCVYDGDGDRIMFFDESKEFVFQDYVIAIYMNYFKEFGKKFVCDLRVSRVLEDIAKENGLDLGLIRVGRSYYEDYMNENGCVYGAELSGHMFFKDFRNLDNPLVALIYMLKIVAQELLKNPEFKFSELVSRFKVYYKELETNLKVKDADKVMMFLEKKWGGNVVKRVDGLSFDFGSYWFNIRKSNTEPIVRVNFEGKEEVETKKRFDELIKLVNKY